MERRRTYVLALASILCWLLDFCVPPAFGQATTGAIVGTVSDASGGVIADAEVTITNTATKQGRIVKTDASGHYNAEALLAGTYDVTVRKEGFNTYTIQGVKLDPSARVSADATLQLGSTVTNVTVTASPVRVETETGESSGIITGDQINQLLMNGRNFASLALLIPGVNSTVGGASLGGGGLVNHAPLSINGIDQSANNYSIDGTYNMNTGDQSSLNIVSPLDTISEFRVLKDNYSAKYGVAGSAQVQVETKSGARGLHGNVYEYLRNDALDASNFFAGGFKTPLKQNNFGFTISGPVVIPGKYNTDRKKTFFFINEEWRRVHSGLTLRGAVFPQALRNGDLTNSPTLRAGGLQFDSVATSLLAQKYPGVNCLPAPNTLDPACFDANAVTIINKYWPLPNNPGGGFLNYINPGVDRNDTRDDTYRVDHYFSDKLRLLARVSYEKNLDAPPAAVWGPNPAPTTTQTIGQTGVNALMRFTAQVSPTAVNEFTFDYSHDKPRLNVQGADLFSGININYPFPDAVTAPGRKHIPTINLAGGWAGVGDIGFPFHASDGAGTLADDFSKVHGEHTLQAGVLYIWGIKRQDTFANTSGSYFFSGVHTNDPAADFLLGLDNTFSQGDHTPRHYSHWRQLETYVQDDWKVKDRLTLNLGLRYVYGSGETIQGNIFSDFDPKTWDPANGPVVLPDGRLQVDANGNPVTASGSVADLLNGIVFPGQPHDNKPAVQRTIFSPWKRAFAPRVGFAWDVFGDRKTSLRGGYGMGYTFYRYGTEGDLINPPWVQHVTFLNGTLTDPALGTPSAKTTQSLSWAGPPGAVRKPVILQNWSLTVQRELLPSGVLSVAYVGSRGTQMAGTRDFNFPTPVAVPSIADPACLGGEAIPPGGFQFDPCLNAGLVSPDFTRPFVGWSNITSFRGAADYFGRSFYHSLQTGYRYRPRKALTLSFAYTWSKVLQDSAAVYGPAQNHRNWRAEYGLAPQDRTHVFSASYIYDLPFFKSQPGPLGAVLGSWTFSGITLIESGNPLTPGLATGTGGLATRPDCIGSVSGPKSLAEWFNTSAFAVPASGFFGNCGNSLIRGPGENTWNWAVFKTFPIREQLKLQFRAEFFNIWNHPNFNGVSTAFQGKNSAGKVIGNFGQAVSAMEPREIEFGLRLDF